MKWIVIIALWLAVIFGIQHYAKAVEQTPTNLYLVACKVKETGKPSQWAHYKDLEWDIVDGVLACKWVRVGDDISADGSRIIGTLGNAQTRSGCAMEIMAIASQWASENPGWWPAGGTCDSTRFSDSGTPGNPRDDRLLGREEPQSCPRALGNLPIKCVYTENEV